MTGQAVEPRAGAVHATTPVDVGTLGKLLAASRFFADAADAAQAAVKVMAGAELGFGPIASMTGVYIVKGRVTLSANLMAAAIKRSRRYDYRITDHSDERCEIEFFDRWVTPSGDKFESIGVSAFSTADATRAGLMGSQTWKQHPRNMLFARAMSNGAKWFCPDIFGGPVYTPDELGADIDGDGEVVSFDPPPPSRQLAPVPEPERGDDTPDGRAADAMAEAFAQDDEPEVAVAPEPEQPPGPTLEGPPERPLNDAEQLALRAMLADLKPATAGMLLVEAGASSSDVEAGLASLAVGQGIALVDALRRRSA